MVGDRRFRLQPFTHDHAQLSRKPIAGNKRTDALARLSRLDCRNFFVHVRPFLDDHRRQELLQHTRRIHVMPKQGPEKIVKCLVRWCVLRVFLDVKDVGGATIAALVWATG